MSHALYARGKLNGHFLLTIPDSSYILIYGGGFKPLVLPIPRDKKERLQILQHVKSARGVDCLCDVFLSEEDLRTELARRQNQPASASDET